MKTKVCAVIMILFYFSSVKFIFAEQNKNVITFINVPWKTERNIVRTIYESNGFNIEEIDDDSDFYVGKIGGDNLYVLTSFYENKLYDVTVSFDVIRGTYDSLYREKCQILTSNYGEPFYKRDVKQMYADTDKTTMLTINMDENYKVTMHYTYIPLSLKLIESQNSEQKKLF